MMRSIFLLMAIALSACSPGSGGPPLEPVQASVQALAGETDIYLLAGQSNACGQQPDRTLLAPYVDACPSCPAPMLQARWDPPGTPYVPVSEFLFHVQGQTYSWHPWPLYWVGSFWGAEMAIDRIESVYGQDVAVVKVCQGSTSLAVDWAPEGTLWQQLIGDTAQMRLDISGTSRIRALIWIQGEMDATDATWAADYDRLLRAMIADARQLWGHRLRIYIVPLHPNWNGVTYTLPHWSTVRAAQDAVCASVYGVTCVQVDDLTGFRAGDPIHYDGASLLTIGLRIAAAEGYP